MPRKRRRDSDEEDGGQRHQGRQTFHERVVALASKANKRRVEIARDYFKNHKAPNPSSEDDVGQVAGLSVPRFDDLWEAMDEVHLVQDYETSGAAHAIRSIGNAHGAHLKMWKTTCWEMRCTPLAIVGPRFNMAFQPMERSSTTLEQTQTSRTLWSKDFCTRLDTLVSHPVWEGDPARLSTAIQTAVIARTNDRRSWLIRIRDAALTGPLKGVMHLATIQCRERGRQVSSFFSLLRHIAELASGPSEASTDPLPVEYQVRLGDLDLVVDAINTLTGNSSVPMFPDVELVATISHASRESGSMPHGFAELQALYKRAWHHERRSALREQRRAIARRHSTNHPLDWRPARNAGSPCGFGRGRGFDPFYDFGDDPGPRDLSPDEAGNADGDEHSEYSDDPDHTDDHTEDEYMADPPRAGPHKSPVPAPGRSGRSGDLVPAPARSDRMESSGEYSSGESEAASSPSKSAPGGSPAAAPTGVATEAPSKSQPGGSPAVAPAAKEAPSQSEPASENSAVMDAYWNAPLPIYLGDESRDGMDLSSAWVSAPQPASRRNWMGWASASNPIVARREDSTDEESE
ncbi:hypothetical protein ACCO45_013519 [Purpureocillium lilacinum]|uniref:Uncharacterized protein n=1 Tax=Purpureocillium lilacinum TaxID=33203 RepID=A0ACC4D6C1_PURLI